ncbi:double-strand break repair helicase AddA [Novosphingobium umbonatum]|uniref:DNA 3'-5' helicase n=1 Tax=Novosphingobium umbonatum TaxID=1908524 RepID=A0A3S2URL3_9SPHN|nr:double-strand break repair helicase AddA [Novosphingobium umbonatum]RVU04461.1 double-strand break repair helicase AddA [Novosphingobium umbonatum]
MSGPAKLHPLFGDQARAVLPDQTVWLSASAGTGKTQVLSARVLRLLLEPQVRPEQILCLTFTKAGATEMAERINATLARWVRADPVRLAQELQAIGADITPEVQARARTLFAAVLDCPGGGLRIDTIHAFSQWLLAAFPQEAGLHAGARPMEEQEKALLSRQVLADLLLDAEARGDYGMLRALESLSLRMGPEDVERWLMRCAGARSLWFGTGSWVPPLLPRVKQCLGLPSDASMAQVVALCEDDAFDVRSVHYVLDVVKQWTDKKGNLTPTAEKKANPISDWLAASAEQRLAELGKLYGAIFGTKGEPTYLKNLDAIAPGYGEYCFRVGEKIAAVRARQALVRLAEWLAPALELGRAFALAWDEAKAREGLIDFDDQIAHAARLLARSDMADWIRYKLDRRFDHILVDEAQDTNASQWQIIEALTEEFFAGEGAAEDAVRTLFVVGDYKQAIFGFQGTSPENFEKARQRVRSRMGGAADNAASYRGGGEAPRLLELGLERSFRTGATVLDFVDRAIAHIGPEAFGLGALPEPHVGEVRPGAVVLWRAVGGKEEAADEEEAEEAQNWLSKPEREMADRIARQVKAWIDHGFPLVKGIKAGDPPRRATPDDVMVLVRKRRELAGLIVARLHAAGVPVAGVDRLRLGAPLAVRDVVAALRFAAQPLDDLNLAALLVSPIFGWSQEQLLAHGYRQGKTKLWDHLRRHATGEAAAVVVQLQDLLGRADFDPVPDLLHWLLVGPWAARKALVARLGREANDPLDELVNAAYAYATTSTPSLVGFLAWFDAGDGELKREAGKSAGLVRVMTVHGSKGLQAPIVILADATGDPAKGMGTPLAVPDPMVMAGDEPRIIPLPGLKKDEKQGPIAQAEALAAKAEAEEHWRLLYVAMTRAEEALFIGGALGAKEKQPAAGSWFARLAEMFGDEAWVEDPIWGATATFGSLAEGGQWAAQAVELDLNAGKPGWLLRSPPEEARPPRPLAPSSLGEEAGAQPPSASSATRAMAARRGVLIHALLERLPPVAEDARAAAAEKWLARQAADLGEEAREEIVQAALNVLADPAWADLFGPDALAEVPIAATVGGQVVAGTIDRLLVEKDRIRLIDFKTARRAPQQADDISVSILRQMAAYALALEAAYPGRVVEASVLYTEGPRLIALPEALLAPHKERLLPQQQSLGL